MFGSLGKIGAFHNRRMKKAIRRKDFARWSSARKSVKARTLLLHKKNS